MSQSVLPLLEKALGARRDLFDAKHESAFRLFNGFTEGCPDLVVDLYAATVIINNYADDPQHGEVLIQEASRFLKTSLPWVRAGIVKTRNGKTQEEKRGKLLFGETIDHKIREHDVWYSIGLTLNRDASLYLDTRNLRKWLKDNLSQKSVLNAFAYTGSLGIAAYAGGASRVIHLDRRSEFLNLAKSSYTLNGFHIDKADFITGDFFPVVSRFKRTETHFYCVILDPPFFSATSRGRVDQEHESARLINKVRPLIDDGGCLVAINNALYVSGRDYLNTLESLCGDGYLKIKQLIPVPEDFIGFSGTAASRPITDPSPFNHSTKIAVLEVRRKQA